MPSTMTEWPFVKTAKVNHRQSTHTVAGVATGKDSGATKKILQNNDVARGESIITF